MFGIDTCQEWLLVIFLLVVILLIACIGIILAVVMFGYYLYKAAKERNLGYLWERV